VCSCEVRVCVRCAACIAACTAHLCSLCSVPSLQPLVAVGQQVARHSGASPCPFLYTGAVACCCVPLCSRLQHEAVTAAAAVTSAATAEPFARAACALHCCCFISAVYSTTTTVQHIHTRAQTALLAAVVWQNCKCQKSWRKQASLSLPLQGSKVCYCCCAAAVRTAHTTHKHTLGCCSSKQCREPPLLRYHTLFCSAEVEPAAAVALQHRLQCSAAAAAVTAGAAAVTAA
jgi:hypothetical protein